MRVLAPHLMTYWYGPAIDELRVYDRAIELDLPALTMLRSLPPLKTHDRSYPDPELRLFISDGPQGGERHYLEDLPPAIVAAQAAPTPHSATPGKHRGELCGAVATGARDGPH